MKYNLCPNLCSIGYYHTRKSQNNLVSGLQSCEEYAVLNPVRQSIRDLHFGDFAFLLCVSRELVLENDQGILMGPTSHVFFMFPLLLLDPASGSDQGL